MGRETTNVAKGLRWEGCVITGRGGVIQGISGDSPISNIKDESDRSKDDPR